VAARRGVPELVPDERGGRQREQREGEAWVRDDVRQAARDAVRGEQPGVERQQRSERDRDDRGAKEMAQHAADRVDGGRRDHRGAHPQAEDGVAALEVGRRAVGAGDDAERMELLLQQVGDLVRADAQIERGADLRRHVGEADLRAGVLGDDVEQARQLHHLAVRAPHEMRRLLQRRAVDGAEQLAARQEAERMRGRFGPERRAGR
jgi:hypothetical protein